MTNDYGMGSGSSYEYVVAEKKTRAVIFKRVALIISYILWVILLIVVGMMIRLIAPLLAFIPLSLWVLVFLTWRLTQVEYELSFFSGKLTVCRILGGRSRKVLCQVMIRQMDQILPYEEEYVAKIEAYGADRTLFAASHTDAPQLYAALWKDEDGKKTILCFEANERALKILRFYNASALTRKPN